MDKALNVRYFILGSWISWRSARAVAGKQGDFLVGLRAQVEISLVVSSRLLLCYKSGLARIWIRS